MLKPKRPGLPGVHARSTPGHPVALDAHAFTIMLSGETFKGALHELGISQFHDFRSSYPTTAITESLDRARRRTYEQLEKSLTFNEDDTWGNEQASRS
jgi:hypothetical protein